MDGVGFEVFSKKCMYLQLVGLQLLMCAIATFFWCVIAASQWFLSYLHGTVQSLSDYVTQSRMMHVTFLGESMNKKNVLSLWDVSKLVNIFSNCWYQFASIVQCMYPITMSCVVAFLVFRCLLIWWCVFARTSRMVCTRVHSNFYMIRSGFFTIVWSTMEVSVTASCTEL